jgi:ABC-2 type transport system ATP-binding protein
MIVLTNLQKVLDQTTVIDIPSLEVKVGSVAALVGAVDSGKEVVFQLLTGAIRPTTGSVRLADLDPYLERDAFSRQVGVLFPDDNLYKNMSVLGNLQFYSRLLRLPKSRVVEVLEQVGLADQAQTNADKLSPSLSRRLALGRALLANPKILLLAEPFTGCEQISITLISQVLRRQVEAGAAALIFAHDTANLEKLCETVHRLERGRIVESYNPGEEQQRNRPFMIPARAEDKIILIDPAEILYAFAQEDRTYLQTLDERLPTQFTLAELEKRLSRSGFFRAHRAYLVNLQQVKEVIPYTRDSFSLRLKDAAETKIPLSKSAERELRELLEY